MSGITTPQGFRAAGITAGIKASGKPDMALVVNDGPEYTAAAVFTSNRIVAAPVTLSRKNVSNGVIRAVLFNSGNANACNGKPGLAEASELAERMAAALDIAPEDMGVCSTGIIGERLPMDIMRAGVDALPAALGTDQGDAAAEAIMTTDTVPKSAQVHRDGWSIGGMGKGVGMMAPALATMLVCLTTDAKISAAAAQEALKKAVDQTFNTLDIDGSTSTNDTVFLLANGASGIQPSQAEVDAAVLEICADIADQLQADAEGVTKRVRIIVEGANSDAEALNAARALGRDNLFKCAMFGSDPNWGRVLAAIGTADAEMDPDNITVTFNGHVVCKETQGTPDAREVDLSGADIEVRVDLGLGGAGRALVRTTDLSHAYVEINSAYST